MCIQDGCLPDLDIYKTNCGFKEFMFDHHLSWDGDADDVGHMSALQPLKIRWSEYDFHSLKSEMEKILALCDMEIARSGVIILSDYPEALDGRYIEKTKKKAPAVSKPKNGFVYLMQTGVHGYTKIGFSIKPKAREKTLQGEDPLLHMIFSMDGTMADERNWHLHFKSKRVRGEWFNLTRQDIEFIKKGDQC